MKTTKHSCYENYATLTQELFAIGRPACLVCEEMVNLFIRRVGVRRVIICADGEEPEQRGADKLQASLKVPSVIFTPLAKDLRVEVIAGLNAELIGAITKDILWTTV